MHIRLACGIKGLMLLRFCNIQYFLYCIWPEEMNLYSEANIIAHAKLTWMGTVQISWLKQQESMAMPKMKNVLSCLQLAEKNKEWNEGIFCLHRCGQPKDLAKPVCKRYYKSLHCKQEIPATWVNKYSDLYKELCWGAVENVSDFSSETR